MFRAILFFAIAAVVIWGVYILSGVDAPVTLTWGDRIFGPYAPFEAAVAATVLALLVLLAWNILAFFWRKPAEMLKSAKLKRREEGYKSITRGLIALATGDTREATRQQMRAEARLPPETPLNKMLTAEIARKTGDDKAAVAAFEKMADDEETRFLGLQGLYEQARKDGDMGRALAILEEANAAAPGTPWVLESLFRVQALSAKWEGARDSLKQLQRKKLIDDEQGKHWRAVVDVEASRERDSADDGKEALSLAKEAYKSHSDFLPAAIQYAAMEVKHGRTGRADRMINDAWAKHPHPKLGAVYEDVVQVHEPKKQYDRFKQLASTNPGHPESRIMLAREAVRVADFEEAKTQLTPVAELDTDARVCRLMADIELASGGDRAVARDWMARAAVAPPDPVWVCNESGAVATEWSAISPTGHFDSMEWRRPSYVPLAQLPNPVDPALLLEGPEAEAEAMEADVETVEAELLPAPDAISDASSQEERKA